MQIFVNDKTIAISNIYPLSLTWARLVCSAESTIYNKFYVKPIADVANVGFIDFICLLDC